MIFLKNHRICCKKLFGSQLRVSRSKIDICELELKNQWPKKPEDHLVQLTPIMLESKVGPFSVSLRQPSAKLSLGLSGKLLHTHKTIEKDLVTERVLQNVHC